MKRTLQLLVASIAICGMLTGIASAATSPNVVTGKVTGVGNTSVTLTGTVNPNGTATVYQFSYGTTPAYGAVSPSRSAGSGTKAKAVTQTISGLTPGTVYHYRISASNGAGSASGADRTFTTTGHPPAGVVTGPAVSVGRTVATPTASINPEGAATSWVVQYGLSTSYSSESIPQALPAVTTPLQVSARLAGLQSGALFHYRIVAFHGASVVSAGLDATFFTEPSKRPAPKLSARTSPGSDKRSPYQFITTGTLKGATSIPAAQRCAGNVGIRYYNGRRQLAFVVGAVGSDCRFSIPASFKRTRGHGATRLTVKVSYRGTGYVTSATATDHVTAG